MRIAAVLSFLAGASFTIGAAAQDATQAATQATTQAPKSKYVSIIGTVEKVDSEGKSFTVKTDKGDTTTIKYDDRTSFLRIPPGEKDVRKATHIDLKEVAPGDRVLARVREGENPGESPAITFYVMTHAELAQHQEKTKQEWQRRGTAGIVASVDPAGKQITLSVRGLNGPPRELVVDASGPVNFRRYSPDSVKFTDATPSSFAEIHPGDRVRVLGDNNEDQTKIKAEEIVSGSFKNVAAQIKSIDPASGQITATDLGSKKPILIAVTADTTMKKLDPMVANILARRFNPSYQTGTGAPGARAPGTGGPGSGRPSGAPGGPPENGPAGPAPQGAQGGRLQDGMRSGGPGGSPGGGPGGSPGAGPGGAGMGTRMDPAQLLERQPSIKVTDLKPGDAIVVTGSPSADAAKISAMTLVAGVEPILTAAPSRGGDPLGGAWNFGDIGMPE
jgi:hypothetical protein